MLIFAGGVCLSYSFLGSVARYISTEVRPTDKDKFNYLLSGSKDAIHDIRGNKVICPSCKCSNDIDAKFCSNCGEKLIIVCSKCNEENFLADNYCKNCGYSLKKTII